MSEKQLTEARDLIERPPSEAALGHLSAWRAERDAAAIEKWAEFQESSLTGSLAYAVEDADRAEVARWTGAARAYAARLREGSLS